MSGNLDLNYKRSEDYRKYIEGQEIKIASQKEALVIEAERKVRDMLLSLGYGEVQIHSSSSDISEELNGAVTVMAAGYKDDSHYTIKFPVSVETGQLQEPVIDDAQRAETPEDQINTTSRPINVPAREKLILADLAEFRLEDDGSPYYKVYHPVFDPSEAIASINRDEYDSAEHKKPILVGSLRQEAGSQGIDLRFAGSFVLPKIEKVSLLESGEEKSWEKEAVLDSGDIIGAGVPVETEFGDGVVENIVKHNNTKKAYINIQGRKLALPLSDISIKKSKSLTAVASDDRDKILQADGIRQFSEGAADKTSRQVEALSAQASRELVNHLIALGFENIKSGDVLDIDLSESRRGFNGSIYIEVSASLEGEEKVFSVPVSIINDQRGFLNREETEKLFNDYAIGSREAAVQAIEREINSNISRIEQQHAWEEEQTQEAYSAMTEPEVVEKIASGTNSPKVTEYAPILHVSRHVLPDGLEEGDTVDIDGARYQVAGFDTNALSTEADSGSLVTLELVPAEPSNNRGEVELEY